MTDNDKATLIEKLHHLANPKIIRNNRISIDWLAIINYIEKQNEKAFTDGVNVTHEYYGTPSLHPITYTKEQYEAYGDQRELAGRIDELEKHKENHGDCAISCISARIAELKERIEEMKDDQLSRKTR